MFITTGWKRVYSIETRDRHRNNFYKYGNAKRIASFYDDHCL